MKSVVACICIFLLIKEIQCLKILGVFPMTSRSHYILGSSLMKALAEKGHDVTFVSPFPEKSPPKNGSYRVIELTGFIEKSEETRKDINWFDMEDVNMALLLPFMMHMIRDLTEDSLSHPNLQKLLHSNEKFDVVIVEQFINEAHKGLASHFDAPLILLSSIGANPWINIPLGNPGPPAYIPNVFLDYSTNMTFFERVKNILTYIYEHLFLYFMAFPLQETIYNKHFPNGPPFYDVFYNVSVALVNSHPSTNQPVPLLPNMIEIGGYHIKPAKQLPSDLQKFLDESKEGVIYFSMGSNVKSSEFPTEKRDAFLKAFSKLKVKVLWKWEEDVLPGQPSNVKLGKWLPQQEILAHPNVKLFMTHGGLLSTTETIYHGVPVLAIPIGADQKLNARRIANDGFGLVLRYKEISENAITEKLNELLENPKYSQNAKLKSKLFHDRQTKPLDTAIYWIEYVARHRGTPHLKVAGAGMPWYKYLLLDVIAFILVCCLLTLYISCKVIKKMCSLCVSSKKKKQKQN